MLFKIKPVYFVLRLRVVKKLELIIVCSTKTLSNYAEVLCLLHYHFIDRPLKTSYCIQNFSKLCFFEFFECPVIEI